MPAAARSAQMHSHPHAGGSTGGQSNSKAKLYQARHPERPLLCPNCGWPMRLIAFITQSADIRQILNHIGVEFEPPHIS